MPDPVEHRTYYRVWEPASELEQPRGKRASIATGMASTGEGEPLIHLGIQTGRRNIDVKLTFWEVNKLCGDLWHAAGILAAAQGKNDKLVECTRCAERFHPDALGGRGRPCRDCGGQVVEVDRIVEDAR